MEQVIDKFFPPYSALENKKSFLKDIYLSNEYRNKIRKRRFFTFVIFSTASFSLGFVSGYLTAMKLNAK